MTDPQPPDPDEAAEGEDLGLERGSLAPEISRRVSTILDAVEHEAANLREEAREEARRYLEYSRRRADELVAERQARIEQLSAEILSKSEAVVSRLDDAAPVRQGFENLVKSLGDAAERLAREADESSVHFEPPPFHDEAAQGGVAPAPGPEQPPAYAPPPGPEQPPAYAPPPAQQPSPAAFQPDPPPFQPVEPTGTQVQFPGPPAEGTGPDPGRSHPSRAPFEQQAPPAAPAPEPAAPAQPPPAESAPAAVPAPHHEATPAGAPAELDNAKLVAIQMAAAGNTRSQVRQHLQQGMGIADTRRVLDEIFGAGSADDARVPWTAFPR